MVSIYMDHYHLNGRMIMIIWRALFTMVLQLPAIKEFAVVGFPLRRGHALLCSFYDSEALVCPRFSQHLMLST